MQEEKKICDHHVHDDAHCHTYGEDHDHAHLNHDAEPHDHEHGHTHHHDHDHSHVHTHTHEHTHDGETHSHEHSHDHSHGHSHAGEKDPMKTAVALLDYMANHNSQHAAELAEVGEMIRNLGKGDAADKIADGVKAFEEANEKLKEALALVKEV